jgi:hypothetical protein
MHLGTIARRRRPGPLGDSEGIVATGAVEDRHEFLATVARDQVARPKTLTQEFAERAQDGIAGLVPVEFVERAEQVEIEQDGRDRRPLIERQPAPRRDHPLAARLEMASVERPGERVADRRLHHRGVELSVGDRQGNRCAQHLDYFELQLAERMGSIESDQANGADHHLVADQRHGQAGHHVRSLGLGCGRRKAATVVRVIEDGRPIADRPAGGAFAGPDLGPEVRGLGVVATERRQPICTVLSLEEGEDRDIGVDHLGQACDDLVVQDPAVEGRVDHGAEGL